MCTQIENVFSHLIPTLPYKQTKKTSFLSLSSASKFFFYSFSSSQIPTPTDLHARIDFTCLPQLHTTILSPHPTTPTLSCKPADVLLRFYAMSACTHGKQADDAKKNMFFSLQTQMKHILVLESLTQMNFQHNCRPEFSRLCAGKK